MDQTEARRRFSAARVGRLATVTRTGTPHLVPVVFALVEDTLYTAVDDKPKTTKALARLANIEATGHASVLVDEYSEDWSTLWWVRVDGPAEVLGADNSQVRVAVQALARKYPQYAGRTLQLPAGPVISLRVSRWHSWEATPTP